MPPAGTGNLQTLNMKQNRYPLRVRKKKGAGRRMDSASGKPLINRGEPKKVFGEKIKTEGKSRGRMGND